MGKGAILTAASLAAEIPPFFVPIDRATYLNRPVENSQRGHGEFLELGLIHFTFKLIVHIRNF